MDRRAFLRSTIALGGTAALAACSAKSGLPATSATKPSSGGFTVPPLRLAKCNNPAAQATGGTVPASPGYALPLAPPGTKIKVSTWDNYDTSRSYNHKLPVWQEIEKRTGVGVDWDVAAYPDWATSMSTRLSA